MTQAASPNPAGQNEPALFRNSGPDQKGAISWGIWAAAGLACGVVLIILMIVGHKAKSAVNPNQQPDPYVANLIISNILMSQASNMVGGSMTYIDGTVQNNGEKTVTGVTVNTIFSNDMGQPPQVDTQVIQLIRAREPYIDTEPVTAAPIQPGASADFRLIFEQVTPNWNQITPEIKVVAVDTK